MSVAESDAVSTALDLLQAELEGEGYRFVRYPGDADLPAFLQRLRPDAIAVDRSPFLLIEVIRRGKNDTSQKIASLEAMLADHPEWLLKVVYFSSQDLHISPVNQEALNQAIGRLDKLIDLDPSATFLMAWSVIEAQMRTRFAERRARPMSTRDIVNALISEGAISQDLGRRLFKLADMRNQLAHGQLDLMPSRDDNQDVLGVVRQLQEEAA